MEPRWVMGGGEAEEPQLRRMETVRELVQALGYALRQRQGLRSAPLSILGAVQRFELNRQHEHPLADVVVQLARDPGTLAFLGSQQTRREIAVALIAPEKLALARPQLSFRLSPSPALNQQPGNQDALREEQSDGAEDVGFVTVPDRWISKPDERAGGDARFVDAPAPKLAPVDLIDVQMESSDRDRIGRLAAEHAEGELADTLDGILLDVETAANDAMVHRRVDPAIGWGIRRRCNSIDVLQWVELVTGPILADEHVVDSRALRQLR